MGKGSLLFPVCSFPKGLNMTTQSQSAAILKHMMDGRSISQLEAAELYGCWRLGARIYDLRDMGYDIKTEMVTNEATGKRFARYYMTDEEIARVKEAA